MTDTQIIQSAYADVLSRLFSVYVDALAAASGDEEGAATATDHFKNGIALARKARDEALRLVQQPG